MSGVAGPVAVGVLAAIATTGHIQYPLWLAWHTQALESQDGPRPATWPAVTVIIPAYRESAIIRHKVNDVLAQEYPGELEVLVVADDPETAAVARSCAARVVAPEARLGKANAINVGVAAASNPVIVITDANAMLRPSSLEQLVRHFDDPAVGAVAGEKRVVGDDGEGLFWRFESWMKQRESRTGSTIGLIGELAAFRAEDFRPLPLDVVVDDLWLALDVVSAGQRIVYEPDAATVERSPGLLAEDWERRTRNVAGALDVLLRRRTMLHPRHGAMAAQLWGHRLVRMSAGPVAHVCLLAVAGRFVRNHRIAQLFLGGHIVGAGSLLRSRSSSGATAPERLLGQVLWLQLVALGGLVRYLRGDRAAAWPKSERIA